MAKKNSSAQVCGEEHRLQFLLKCFYNLDRFDINFMVASESLGLNCLMNYVLFFKLKKNSLQVSDIDKDS